MTDQTCMDVACPGKTRCSDPDCSPARADATYTAAEVKVLTETATKLGYALGRKEAQGEIYGEMSVVDDWVLDDPRINWVDVQIDKDTYRQLRDAFHAISDAPSGTTGSPKLSEDAEAVRTPQGRCGHPTCPCNADKHNQEAM